MIAGPLPPEGSLFSHLTVGTSDLERAAAFYDTVLNLIGLRRRAVTPDGGPRSACWVAPGQLLPRFYVYEPFDGDVASAGNGGMVAFLAPSHEAGEQAYAAGLAAGGTDEGGPRLRSHYGDGYYGAYLRDLDGNKLHLVFRGDLPMQPGGTSFTQETVRTVVPPSVTTGRS